MHPLSHKPIDETLPIVCCFLKYFKKKKSDEDENIEEKEFKVLERDKRLKTLIKKYQGRYYGTSYLYDAKKA